MNHTLQNASSQPSSLNPFTISIAPASFMSGANKTAEPLGNTTFYGARMNTWASQRSAVDSSTGEIIDFDVQNDGTLKRVFDNQNFRASKYMLQKVSKRLLRGTFIKDTKEKSFRVQNCLEKRVSVSGKVSIYKSTDGNTCHYKGLMMCGSVWTCPICASKVSERKSATITDLIERHKAAGGNVLLVTFTVPHTRDDELETLLPLFKAAESSFHKTKPIRNIKKSIGYIEAIKSLEITYGHENGWHPHYHQLWFTGPDIDTEKLKLDLYKHWSNHCNRRKLGIPSFQRGLDVRQGLSAGSYISKMGWNLSREITKSHLKKAKKGRFSPFDLLQHFADTSEKWAAKAYRDYATATHGMHFISRFPILQKLYSIQDKSDEELANQADSPSYLLCEIEQEDWNSVLQNDQRSNLLSIAESGSLKAVQSFLNSLKKPPD